MKYLLDTDVCVDYLRGRRAVVERLQATPPGAVCVSPIVVAELRYGAERSSQPKRNHRLLDDLLVELRCAPFEETAAREYGRVRAALERAGGPIGPNDMLIAAQARSLGLTLVTANRREFRRVPRLRLAGWR